MTPFQGHWHVTVQPAAWVWSQLSLLTASCTSISLAYYVLATNRLKQTWRDQLCNMLASETMVKVHSSFNTITVWEQHPRSHHKGATSMQNHVVVREGLKWRPTASSSMSLPPKTRRPWDLGNLWYQRGCQLEVMISNKYRSSDKIPDIIVYDITWLLMTAHMISTYMISCGMPYTHTHKTRARAHAHTHTYDVLMKIAVCLWYHTSFHWWN